MTGRDHVHFGTGKRFAVALALNLGFVVCEVAFGLRYDSLALLSDAGHNLSDVMGLLLAWVAHVLAQREPSRRHSYGLRHLSTLAALANALALLVVVGGTAWEAIRRFEHPVPTEGGVMMLVAGVGVAINLAAASLFREGARRDLNLQGAFIHLAGDAAVSFGVVLAGLAIATTGQAWIDPAASLFVSCAIVVGTSGLLRRSLRLAMGAVPETVDLDRLDSYFKEFPGASSVHDLHVWAVGTTDTALTVHVVDPASKIGDAELSRMSRELRVTHGIGHVTIQVERGTHPCERSGDRVL